VCPYMLTLLVFAGLVAHFSVINLSGIVIPFNVISSQLALAPADYNLTELKLDLFRIVCSHEHYIALNLPLFPPLDPSPSPNSDTFEDGIPSYIESMAILTPKFRQQHYLCGLVLSELARVLAGR